MNRVPLLSSILMIFVLLKYSQCQNYFTNWNYQHPQHIPDIQPVWMYSPWQSYYSHAPITDSPIQPTPFPIETPNTPITSSPVAPNPSDCGIYTNADKIYGGNNTALEEFPWMAVLQYRNFDNELVFLCGGMLINKRYILTAAHCLTGQIIKQIGPLVNVRLGEWNTDTNPDCIEYPDTGKGIEVDCADQYLDFVPDQIIPHLEYNSNNQTNNDIGLIRLPQDIDYTDFISPICLPSTDLKSQTGDRVMVSGWGRTLKERRSAIKQKLIIEIADHASCVDKYAAARRSLDNSQICAGGKSREDSCDGDSGGPLMKLINNQWYAEGIVSFGNRCGVEGWPAIYVRVNSYLDWIASNMN